MRVISLVWNRACGYTIRGLEAVHVKIWNCQPAWAKEAYLMIASRAYTYGPESQLAGQEADVAIELQHIRWSSIRRISAPSLLP